MRALYVFWMQLGLVLFAAACGGGSQQALRVNAMPEGGSFTGVWFSPQYGEMHIRQEGSTALGRYTKDERVGRLQGRVEGDVLRFEWSEARELIVGRPVQTRGHGYFRIVKDDAEGTWKLVGEWGNDAAERGGGPWNAVKSKTRKPDLDRDGNARSSGSSGSSGEDKPQDFSGTDDSGQEDLSDL